MHENFIGTLAGVDTFIGPLEDCAKLHPILFTYLTTVTIFKKSILDYCVNLLLIIFHSSCMLSIVVVRNCKEYHMPSSEMSRAVIFYTATLQIVSTLMALSYCRTTPTQCGRRAGHTMLNFANVYQCRLEKSDSTYLAP